MTNKVSTPLLFTALIYTSLSWQAKVFIECKYIVSSFIVLLVFDYYYCILVFANL